AFGTVSQRDLLGALGIDARATALAAAAPERGEAILADRNRLVGEDAMGHLFRALAVTAPAWPIPAGFA
ncbi:MAG TPA: class I SAM-dependent methyltransferase, partial [Sphingomonas sp.]|nr:class I SAM-dependent methyltransferase [Sphingomonas sp.]